jgi:hypothetical protein
MKIGTAGRQACVCDVYLIFTRQRIDLIKETAGASSSQLAAACNNSVTVFVKLVTTQIHGAHYRFASREHVQNPSSLFEVGREKRVHAQHTHAHCQRDGVAFISSGREQIPAVAARLDECEKYGNSCVCMRAGDKTRELCVRPTAEERSSLPASVYTHAEILRAPTGGGGG